MSKAATTPKDVHNLADKLNVSWDNDPGFMAWTKQVVGKEHLDDMSEKELRAVVSAMKSNPPKSDKVAVNIPKKVEEYAKSVQDKNPDYDDAKVWATAWSIYCKYKEPGSEHCKKDTGEYFPGKGSKEAESDLSKSWGGYSTFRPHRHGYDKDQFGLISVWKELQ